MCHYLLGTTNHDIANPEIFLKPAIAALRGSPFVVALSFVRHHRSNLFAARVAVNDWHMAEWYDIASSDTSSTANDILTLGVYNPTTGELLQTLATLSNLDVTNGAYAQSSQYDLIAYKGQAIRLAFISTDNTDSWPTYFYLDDVELPVTAPAQQNLSVAITGNGSVNSNPAGIACTTGNMGS